MFTNLTFWKKAHEFTLAVYKLTRGFPKEELYGLSSQFRRAAVSVPANIAEGYSRTGKKDKLKFFNVSLSSLQECKYYLILSEDLNYGSHPELMKLTDEIGKLLNAYCRTIRGST